MREARPAGETGRPQSIGGVRLDACLGVSAAGRIYRGQQQRAGVSSPRPVFVKLLGSTSMQTGGRSPSSLLDYARPFIGIHHENMINVLDVGIDTHLGTRTAYIVYEWIDGEDLALHISQQGPLSPQDALAACVDIARGLAAAASAGVMHRDVRPGHVLRRKNGVVAIGGMSMTLPWYTAHGRELYGMAAYAAPEYALGRPVDFRADIYSLGCTLFELTTGKPPFGFGGPDALLACHVHEPFPALREVVPLCPLPVEKLLARWTSRNPEQRPEHYTALISEATHVLSQLPPEVATKYALVIEEGRQSGLVVRLPEGSLLLGRIAEEGLAIDDARISRRHAMLYRYDDDVFLEDLGSRNGVQVNGISIQGKVRLRAGDRIRLGDTVCFLEGNNPALQSSSRAHADAVSPAWNSDVMQQNNPKKHDAALPIQHGIPTPKNETSPHSASFSDSLDVDISIAKTNSIIWPTAPVAPAGPNAINDATAPHLPAPHMPVPAAALSPLQPPALPASLFAGATSIQHQAQSSHVSLSAGAALTATIVDLPIMPAPDESWRLQTDLPRRPDISRAPTDVEHLPAVQLRAGALSGDGVIRHIWLRADGFGIRYTSCLARLARIFAQPKPWSQQKDDAMQAISQLFQPADCIWIPIHDGGPVFDASHNHLPAALLGAVVTFLLHACPHQLAIAGVLPSIHGVPAMAAPVLQGGQAPAATVGYLLLLRQSIDAPRFTEVDMQIFEGLAGLFGLRIQTGDGSTW